MRRAFLFLMALGIVACGGKVFVDQPSGAGGGSSTTGGGNTAVGGAPSTGSFGEGASAAGGSTSCFACVCENNVAQGGCADICTMGINGTTTPNFCDGAKALAQCAACIASNCGNGDPSTCTM